MKLSPDVLLLLWQLKASVVVGAACLTPCGVHPVPKQTSAKLGTNLQPFGAALGGHWGPALPVGGRG